MQKLTPSIWFNRTAAQAADLYLSAFSNSSIISQHNYPTEGLPEFQKDFAGEPLMIDMDIEGFRLSLTNADASFAPNPSISFMLNFDPMVMDNPKEELERTWNILSKDGIVRMPLDSYDFSEYFG